MFVPDYQNFFQNKQLVNANLIVDIDQFEVKNTDTYYGAVQKELDLKNIVWKNFYKRGES